MAAPAAYVLPSARLGIPFKESAQVARTLEENWFDTPGSLVDLTAPLRAQARARAPSRIHPARERALARGCARGVCGCEGASAGMRLLPAGAGERQRPR